MRGEYFNYSTKNSIHKSVSEGLKTKRKKLVEFSAKGHLTLSTFLMTLYLHIYLDVAVTNFKNGLCVK